MKLEILGNLFA